MFLSPLFRETLATLTGAVIELYNTDGALGAARGAAVGSGYFKSANEAFRSLEKLDTVEPRRDIKTVVDNGYNNWKLILENQLKKLKKIIAN